MLTLNVLLVEEAHTVAGDEIVGVAGGLVTVKLTVLAQLPVVVVYVAE